MAAIIGQSISRVVISGNDNPNISKDIAELGVAIFPGLWFDFSNPNLQAAYSQYRQSTSNKWPIVGQKNPSFFDDYYNRIHVNPSTIDLGNLLSVQTVQIDVWNAFIAPNTLVSLTANNVDGIDITEPLAAPTIFEPLEVRVYTLSISTIGSPVIDASYEFQFDTEQAVLVVTGKRVTIWPYKPKYPFKERYEWLTDIIQLFNGEQRIRLREFARQSVSFESDLSLADYSTAKAIANSWVHRVFGVPIWTESKFLASLTAGSVIINVNTENCDFRSDDIILIWSSNKLFEAVETTTVSNSSISLKNPTLRSYSNCFIVPLRFGLALNGINFERDADSTISASTDFTVRNNINIASIGTATQFMGKTVFLYDIVSSRSPTNKYTRQVDIFDNGSGPIEIDIKTGYVNRVSSIAIKVFGIEDVWRFKQLLHTFYGRQKSFFIPDWHSDFVILDDIGSTAGFIRVVSIGFSLHYSAEFIFIKQVNGSMHFSRIIDSTDNGDGSETLQIDQAFGQTILASNVHKAGILKHVRLDADKIDLTHKVSGEMDCAFSVKEVPYVV